MKYSKSILGTGRFIDTLLPDFLNKIDNEIDLIIRPDEYNQVRYIVRYTRIDDPKKAIHLKVFTKLTATYGDSKMANGKPFVGVHNGGRGFEEFYIAAIGD